MKKSFSTQQEEARQRTRILVIAFHAIVLLTALATTAFYVFLLQSQVSYGEAQSWLSHLWRPDSLKVFGIVYLMIVGVSWVRSLPLKKGGSYVARMVGGREVSFETKDPRERQLVNIVEEMGIASGMTLPRVFILDEEESINAFAAGTRLSNACVAVSRGALERLTRDELQGVVAHEFSHILNGDMALNIHLLGYLYGLTSISDAGRIIMRRSTRSRSSKNNAGPLVGLGLFIIGSLGYFFALLLKAGVSRDRERLADASAVQFTRNPEGIGGALRKIWKENFKGPSSARSSEISHFYLHWPRPFLSFLATHPPILERIKNIGVSGEGITSEAEATKSFDQLEAVSAFAAVPVACETFGLDPVSSAFAFYFWLEQSTGSASLGAILSTNPRLDPERLRRAIEELSGLSNFERYAHLERSVALLREQSAEEVSGMLAQMKALIEQDKHISQSEFIYYYYLGMLLKPEPKDRSFVTRQKLGESLEALGHFVTSLVPALHSRDVVRGLLLPLNLRSSGRTQSSLAQVRSALQTLGAVRPREREKIYQGIHQLLSPYESQPAVFLVRKLLALILEIV